MSDLISRSEAARLLYQYAETKHHNGEIELANGILKARNFIEKAENIPTAYDVDKVVEQLKQMRDLNYNVYQEYEDYINCGKMMGYEEAIEIVKEGGVECD